MQLQLIRCSLAISKLQGKSLIFVLKLDEAEIIYGQKMERLSITLMNCALNMDIDLKSDKYFSVQSEREIWPVASFRVPRETHQILSWVFKGTRSRPVTRGTRERIFQRRVAPWSGYEDNKMCIWAQHGRQQIAFLHILFARTK